VNQNDTAQPVNDSQTNHPYEFAIFSEPNPHSEFSGVQAIPQQMNLTS